MKLLLYDTEMQTANGYLPRAITQAAAQLLGEGNALLCDHASVVEQAASGTWDGLLAIGGAGADRHLLEALRETPLPRLLWTTEDPYERRLLERVEPVFDHVFSNEVHCAGASPRTTYLPLAAEPSVHQRPVRCQDSDYAYDLTFVGTAWPNRVASLRRLLAELPGDLRLHLCLPWNRHIPEPELPGIGALPQLRLAIGDLCDIWNRSRVVLTIGREFSAGAGRDHALGSSPPPRVYETAMAGGFQVALAGAGLDLRAAYGELIPLAANEAEAAALIAQHLAAPEPRIARAQAIQAHTLAHHSYGQRLAVILERLEQLRRERQPSPIHLQRRQPAVLHVAHNLVGLRRAGGTEAYVQELAQLQRQGRPVFGLAPKDRMRLALIDYNRPRPRLVRSLKVGKISRFPASHPAYERAFCEVISDYGIGLVHVHHLIGLPLSLPLFAKALGCRVVVTLHDFHLACHRYTLLGADGRFCAIHEAEDHRLQCRLCLQAAGLQGEERSRRLALSRRSVAAADLLLASTPSSAAIAAGVYPEVADRIAVLEMLTPGLETLEAAHRPRPPASFEGPLQVGVIGNAMPHKGLDTLVRLIRASHDQPFQLHILGATPELDQALEEAGIGPDAAPIVRYQGAYDRRTLVQVLQRLHGALFLSPWPETYNICLGEAMRLGVVPVATAVGAHVDRVSHRQSGLLVPPTDPLAVLQALQTLDSDRELLARLSAAAAAVPLMDPREHGQRLEAIYAALNPWRGRDPAATAAGSTLQLDPQLDLAALGVRLAQDRWIETGVRWDEQP
ncbi:MAG: glycosyltransferase [Cyanobacteria bacterium K_DeepCast_150m_m2_101]|nr:glycosyltransferase [Cyanobacteria bacterium K_DeepCast_0m_m1_088]MBM5818687.1 glycosyltransferase [Cyanobacteria bacterium K_DeepCast_150m_m2_101]